MRALRDIKCCWAQCCQGSFKSRQDCFGAPRAVFHFWKSSDGPKRPFHIFTKYFSRLRSLGTPD